MKNEKVIPVFFAADENYMPFLAVTLTSMKEHISKERTYKIHILYTGELGENASKVQAMQTDNFTVCFVDVAKKTAQIQSVMRCRDYYTSAIYFRLFIPELFPQYDKAIYLDCDLVLRADIAELYDKPLGDNLVGAVADEVVAAIPEFSAYTKNALGIESEKYFNSGVLSMNLKALRALDFFKTFYGILSSYDFVVAPDQDCLNLICENRVCYFGGEWNTMPTASERGEPKLVHYNLCMKPWHYDGVAYEKYFWETAKKTCFYESILAKKSKFTKARANQDKRDGKNLLTLAKREAEREDNYLRSVKRSGAGMDLSKVSKARKAVLARIEEYEKAGFFDKPVEDDLPPKELTPNKVDYLNERLSSRVKTRLANFIADRHFLRLIKKDILIIDGVTGQEHLSVLEKGAVITCNHFSPFDNYIVFHCIRKSLPRKYLYKVIREGNYTSFKGLYGFFFRHCNTLPLSSNRRTMINFSSAVNTLLKRGESILIYPEQEMWWNYKKPRPFKVGGFKMACRAGVPVLPTFITMTDDPDRVDGDGYPLQRHTLHILPPVYPDPTLAEKLAAEKMCEQAYAACVQKYKEIYS